ncbi:hypothetical protein ACIRL2_41610 [Embleya sp. NPDC127516]|uniref:hypothetical protein n=1 Tax=Embleya sp. NPDC127516 TaxID=3363990 RepID=UPI0037F71E36
MTSTDPFSEIVGRSAIEAALRGIAPRPVTNTKYFVRIAGRAYPVKQVARTYTGVQTFNTRLAQRFLRLNGFEIHKH